MVTSIAFIVAVVVAIAICMVGEIRRAQKIRAKYPPISDEEFMAKLPPGTSRDIAMRVRSIVAEQMGVDRERIHPDTKFTDLYLL